MRRLYYLALVVLSGAGLWGVWLRITDGLKVTALTSYVSWGLWVAFYIFFIGLSAGSFLLSTLVYVFGMKRLEKVGKVALLSALCSLGAGVAFIAVDLGHPGRFWHTLVYRNFGSVLAWEIFFYILYALIILAELWFLTYSLNPKRMAWVKALGIVGIPVAIGVHGGTGSIFALAVGRPYWNSGLLPIIFLVSALASGAALVTFLWALLGERTAEKPSIVRTLAQLMALFLVLDGLLLASEFLVGLYSGIPHEKDALIALTDRFWLVFWVGQLGLGLLVPITLIVLPFTNRSIRWLGAAGLSAVVGILAVRMNLVIPAYIIPQFEGLSRAYVDTRLQYAYTPTATEWLVALGLVSLTILLFSLTYERVNVSSKQEVLGK